MPVNVVPWSVKVLRPEIYGMEENVQAILDAASMSYQKPIKTEKSKFLQKLLDLKHYSCFEHTDFLLGIIPKTNVSVSFYHNLRDSFNTLEAELFIDGSRKYNDRIGRCISGSFRDIMNFYKHMKYAERVGERYTFSDRFKFVQGIINGFIMDFLSSAQGKSSDYEIIRRNKWYRAIDDQRVQIQFKAARYTMDQHRTHRTLSFLAESGRRVSYNEDLDIIFPVMPYLNEEEQKTADAIMFHTAEACGDAYSSLIHIGVKKEDARCILPIFTANNYITTASLFDWAQFVKKRLVLEAQSEIRNVALDVDNKLSNIFGERWKELMKNE